MIHQGFLDDIKDGRVVGWAWRPDRPTDRVSVDLLFDDVRESSAIAAAQRPDLVDAGIGDGNYGFEFALPTWCYDGQTHVVRVCHGGTMLDLEGSPRSLLLEPDPRIKIRRELDERVRTRASQHPSERPRVSVVISCYDQGQHLDEAVDTVFEQTLQDFEILIVNDGSSDSFTNTLLRDYQRPKTVVITQPHRGPGAAKNVGLRAARGAYVCALDADHKLEPTYFERSVDALDADPTLAFVSSSLRLLGDQESVWRPDRCDLVTLLAECTVSPAALVRREAMDAVAYYDEDPALWGHEDWILWITLVERGFRGHILPDTLLYYRKRFDSPSGFWAQGQSRLERIGVVVRKHAASYREHFVDVVMRKEAEFCDLLRENDNTERRLSWLKRQGELWQNENARLQSKVDALPSNPAASTNDSGKRPLDSAQRRAKRRHRSRSVSS